ncbi:MAG: cobalamin-dependent protein, partial [Oscillospiraceae bacterium]|nr:cobalamin-dependent protein [Oscillospiraceae bacterium]
MNLLNTRQPYNSVALVCIRTSFKDELGWSKSIGLEYLKLSIKDYCNVITLYGDIDASELQKYDVIGFSLNAENIKNSIRVAETLKNLSKKCIIIVGGPLIDESNIANVAIAMKANFAIIGEGELALVHLVQKRF